MNDGVESTGTCDWDFQNNEKTMEVWNIPIIGSYFTGYTNINKCYILT
jgi:hypothetical protein